MLRTSRAVPACLVTSACLLAPVTLQPVAAAQCPGWSDALSTFTGFVYPRDVATFDDGQGAGATLWLAHTGASWEILHSSGGVKRWSGSAWVESMPTNSVGITSLAVFDEGPGPRLFGAGYAGVWRLDGTAWTHLGPTDGRMFGLEVLDLGSGPELYAFGRDSTPSGAACIVKRTQGGWTSLSQNIGNGSTRVSELAVYDPGTGPALFAAGQLFDAMTGQQAVMQRTPTGWVSIGGTPANYHRLTFGLLVHDDGSGRALYAPFGFVDTMGFTRAVVARWNGTTWTELPGHFMSTPPGGPSVLRLGELADDASGTPRLFASGTFDAVGGAPVANIARWDGQSWSGLGSGIVGGQPRMLAPLSAAEGGPRLIVGGGFEQAGGLSAYHLASWIGCGGVVGTVVCAGDGSAAACPCGAGGAQRGCPNSVEPLGARLQAIGTSGLTSDTLRLEGSGMPNAAALYLQGTSIAGGGSGAPFGDGLMCAAGSVVRLGTSTNALGASQYPEAGDLPVSQRGMITSPGARTYQVWYRNAATFCTPATFNLTNGVTVSWSP